VSLTSTASLPGPAGLALADLPDRIIAFVLDVIALAAAGMLLALVVGGLFGGLSTEGSAGGGSIEAADGGLEPGAFLVVALAQLALSFAYFGYSWVGLRRTPGMRLLDLRIGHQADGQPLSWNQALVRWLVLGVAATIATYPVFVPGPVGLLLGALAWPWLLVLLVTAAQSPTRQGLHDRYARTILVKVGRRSPG
jgi:uncharacterized RDD family membrane protein YckC